MVLPNFNYALAVYGAIIIITYQLVWYQIVVFNFSTGIAPQAFMYFSEAGMQNSFTYVTSGHVFSQRIKFGALLWLLI